MSQDNAIGVTSIEGSFSSLLTDGVADFVRSGALAGLARAGVVDGHHSELPLAVLGQVRHRVCVSADRR